MSRKIVILSARQTALYGGSDEQFRQLMAELIHEHGPCDATGSIEVVHPDGFTVEFFEGHTAP